MANQLDLKIPAIYRLPIIPGFSTHPLTQNPDQKNYYLLAHGLNMRCFEAPACKALLITDQVADLPLCYQKNQEVLVYNSGQEISDILATFENDNYVEVATRGYKKARNHHTYKMRLEKVIKDYSKFPS